MESLSLRVFREVAAAQSISAAAQRMHYVQSNVTAHIKRLEKELGTVLFDRHATGVTLTEDGEKLLYYANEIVRLIEKAAAEFQGTPQKLRIGASQTLAAGRLPAWLSAFGEACPRALVSVTTGDPKRLVFNLERAALDCAFVQPAYLSERIKTIFSFEEELRVAAPAHCEETKLKTLPLLVTPMETCPYRKLLLDWSFQQTGRLPQVMELDTVEAILNSIALGMGISLLPAGTMAMRDDIAFFQIAGMDKMKLHMAVPLNQQSAAADAFMKIVKRSFVSSEV